MFLAIVIAFVSLIGLLVLHEFGHFILAKRFGVKVEEFGVGYPPRIFGKKIGETIYSINLLPFGAFVRVPGEIGGAEEERSFSRQSIPRRVAIMMGGVVSFWIMSSLIFTVVFNLGAPVAIGDEEASGFSNPRVQIAAVSPGSPAEIAGIKPGDTVLKFGKVKELQEFAEANKGKEILLTVQRGRSMFDVSLSPRANPPSGEGPLGVALVRMGTKSYPWWQTPWQGISQTWNLTLAVFQGYYQALANIFQGTPSGVQLTGPVGIFHLMGQASQMGVSYFLNFIGLISIYLAIFNVLPIPATDGGKLIFLGIEFFRKKPVAPKLEQGITTAFFLAMILLMVWVTIKDVIRIF
ncbi:MAG: site-2 protease family protein [Candidatus Nealsonbacteria bacterium]|nr:site-2 protease family protein [Candidatus Nealsonbacteria bacterium]